MAAHSNILAWRMSWTEEPGGLQSMWLQRVGHDGSDLACMHPLPISLNYLWSAYTHTHTHTYHSNSKITLSGNLDMDLRHQITK